jgi:hypothetical protein
VLLVESEYEASSLAHQRGWVTALIDEMNTGVLTWPNDPRQLTFPDGDPLAQTLDADE